jgi:hypothetical protein
MMCAVRYGVLLESELISFDAIALKAAKPVSN